MSTKKITASFSKAAPIYDDLTGLHRTIADELVMRIDTALPAKTVLDIGCGTGYLTHQLKKNFSIAHVTGIDAAEGMIQQAQMKYPDISFKLANALSLPFEEHSIDLIVSNLAYQWIRPLEESFVQVKNVLSPQGCFHMAIFGKDTCGELMTTLQAVGLTPLERLPDIEEVKCALDRAGFHSAKVSTERVRIELNTMFQLLTWLKSIGANHVPINGFLGRQKLFVMSEYYRKAFPLNDGISVTFEVIWIKS